MLFPFWVYVRSVNNKMFEICNKLFRLTMKRFYSSAANVSDPLNGVKIMDLTRLVAGPLCTMVLGDLGADVFKIEEIDKGDLTRAMPPFIRNTDVSCSFISVNRNKKSVCINIKCTEGQNIVKELAEKCDVLVENYIPGKLAQYGLGYDQLKQIAPRLIYCSITGYGYQGPYRGKPGVDLIAASLGGLLHTTGPENGDPCKVGVPVIDMMTGLYAHGAIIAALLNRCNTGLGQNIDCNLFSTQVSSLTGLGMNYLNAGMEAKRTGTAHGGIVPYETFKTKDGYVTIGAMSDKQFKEVCAKLSISELSSDERFHTNQDRIQNKKMLMPILNSVFLSKTTEEWCRMFEGSPFPFSPVNSLAQVFDDPHIKSIGLVKEVEHPTAGNIKLLGPAVNFSHSNNNVRLPPPLLGQHTVEVLRSILSYSDEQISNLQSNGVINAP